VTGALELDISFRFGARSVVECAWRHPFDEGGVTVLLGASGSGKTTLLRCIAGLERPSRGYIRFGSGTWFDRERRVDVPPERRHVGMVFQEYALFPHMTIEQNVTFGAAHMTRAAAAARFAELAEAYSLRGLEARLPRQLSGGEQQRVALARAVFRGPRLLLLDEPLSALDAVTRENIREELRLLVRQLGIPTYIVTHDRADALALADRTVLMDGGRVIQSGRTREVFGNPQTPVAARLVGVDTVLIGRVKSIDHGLATISVDGRDVRAEAPAHQATEAALCIRAEDVLIARRGDADMTAMNRWPCVIRSETPEGPFVRLTLDAGFRLTALVTRDAWERLAMHTGDEVVAIVKAASIRVLSRR
jgi:molybdate transport system ATP-binding protein